MRVFSNILYLIFLSGVLLFPKSGFAQLSPGDLMQSHADLEGMNKCTLCHTFGKKITNEKCLDCHKDLNSLIKSNRGYHSSKEVKPKNCIDCHSDHHGRNFDAIRFEEKGFDHRLTSYELEGAHENVDCRACHKSSNIDNREIAKRKETWLGLEKECLSCHDDFHQGTLETKCLDCHDMKQFRPASRFDHASSKFELRGAHQTVDCISCHKSSTRNGKDFQQFKGLDFKSCASCHQDVHEGRLGANCVDCHTENSFTQLRGNNQFDHSKTRFSLHGMHKYVSCSSCHKGEKTSSSIQFDKCKSCHQDSHRGQFTSSNPTADCKDCHSVFKSFDYTTYSIDQHNSSSPFKLEGAHLATPCVSCHLMEKKWEFRNIGSDCYECHGDVHENTMSNEFYNGVNCTSCHSSESWSSISFDHSRTDFELEGTHSNTDCRNCHLRKAENSENKTVVSWKFIHLTDDCASCHDNIHGAQFQVDEITDCRRCHSTSVKWIADKFKHEETRFPLDGKHVNVDCSACHKPKKSDNGEFRTEYKIEKFECIDCHS